MTNKKLDPVVRDWLKQTEVDPDDVRRSTHLVSDRASRTRQRSRWWPLPSLRRQPSPRPTNTDDSQQSNVTGRTQSMFSSAKVITAGAIVFGIGGVFLIAQPFDQQSAAPGAEIEAVAPTWVTGEIQPAAGGGSCSNDPDVMDGDVRRLRNVECSPQTWTSSDPRFTGEVVRRWNDDVYPTDEGSISVSMAAAYLRNEDAGWACSANDLLKGFGMSSAEVTGTTWTCIGDGGYEGLSALLVSEPGPGFSEEFVGLIFSGDFPPMPEPPDAPTAS
jgi:hypothetical protein